MINHFTSLKQKKYQKIIKEINKNTLGTILEAMQYKNFLRAMKVLSRWKLLTAHGWDSSRKPCA